jgi:flagellar assembly protein FliH
MKSSSSVIRSAAIDAEPVRLGGPLEGPAGFAAYGVPVTKGTARQQLATQLEAEYHRGYADGVSEGRAQAAAETEGLRSTLELVVQELWEHREAVLAEVEPDVVRLALEVARRVVGDVASKERSVVERTVTEALRRVSGRDHLTLRINPEDLEPVRAERERWLALVEGVEHLEIVEDRRVPRGGALVTTRSGSVDARWTTQLAEIERALTGEGTGRAADA